MEKTMLLNPEGWVDSYADMLFSFALTRINDRQLAEDIVQETFLSAWKFRNTYNQSSSEKNWLFAICKNKITDHFRKKWALQSMEENEEEISYFNGADHWTFNTQPEPWKEIETYPGEHPDFYKVFHHCRKKLKELQSAVFSMKYMDEMKSEDIYTQLGISEANYWVLIHRAKLHLRDCMKKNWMNI